MVSCLRLSYAGRFFPVTLCLSRFFPCPGGTIFTRARCITHPALRLVLPLLFWGVSPDFLERCVPHVRRDGLFRRVCDRREVDYLRYIIVGWIWLCVFNLGDGLRGLTLIGASPQPRGLTPDFQIETTKSSGRVSPYYCFPEFSEIRGWIIWQRKLHQNG